jgi:tetrapyrrole methylase family protein/MazG family protein
MIASKKDEKKKLIQELLEIVSILRSEQGCPWDKKQTHQSLVKYLEEEAWEVKDSIQEKKIGAELKEELGDILLQVAMHAEIAKEHKNFDFYDVVSYLNEKLIRRHPHVFDKENIKADFDIEKEWDKIKEKELGKKYHPLERIPEAASLEYFFQKIVDFEKKQELLPKINFSLLNTKLKSLEAAQNKQQKSKLLGEVFCDLVYFAYGEQLSWASILKKQFSKRKNLLLKKTKKRAS